MVDSYYNNRVAIYVLKMINGKIINYNYLIIDTINNLSIIVDPAWDIDKILNILAITKTSLIGILLTHSHPDHTNLAIPLSSKYNCPIWMSNIEIAEYKFKADRLIGVDTAPWSIGQIEIQPILTPGHTLGSICYLINDSLFSGDTLFAEGCGMCPDKISAYSMYMSIQLLKKRIKPDMRVFPGHSYGKMPGQKFSLLLKDNIYLQFSNANDFVAFRMRKEQKAINLFNFK